MLCHAGLAAPTLQRRSSWVIDCACLGVLHWQDGREWVYCGLWHRCSFNADVAFYIPTILIPLAPPCSRNTDTYMYAHAPTLLHRPRSQLLAALDVTMGIHNQGTRGLQGPERCFQDGNRSYCEGGAVASTVRPSTRDPILTATPP